MPQGALAFNVDVSFDAKVFLFSGVIVLAKEVVGAEELVFAHEDYYYKVAQNNHSLLFKYRSHFKC